MKKNLSWRYKRHRVYNVNINDETLKQKRRMFSKLLVGLLETKTRVINFDETALVSFGAKNYSWYPSGKYYNEHQQQVRRRMSILAAVDNFGEIFVGVTTKFVQSEVVSLTLALWSQLLNQEDPNWRKTTVIVMDNASYHVSN